VAKKEKRLSVLLKGKTSRLARTGVCSPGEVGKGKKFWPVLAAEKGKGSQTVTERTLGGGKTPNFLSQDKEGEREVSLSSRKILKKRPAGRGFEGVSFNEAKRSI